MGSSLVKLARILASASVGTRPRRPRAKVAAVRHCGSSRSATICGTAGAATSPMAARAKHGLAADLRPGVLQFSRQGGDRLLGLRPDVPQHDAGPIGGLVVLQGFDQGGHGLRARLGHGLEDPHPHARIGIVHELHEQRHGHLGSRPDVGQRPDGLAADGHVGVAQQVDQAGGGRLGRRADLAQRRGGMGADRRRRVF